MPDYGEGLRAMARGEADACLLCGRPGLPFQRDCCGGCEAIMKTDDLIFGAYKARGGVFIDKNGRTQSEHGTLNRYLKWGCRCDPCKEAGRLDNKRRRAASHTGSLYGYKHGCRCDGCRRAHTDDVRKYRRRNGQERTG